MIDHATEDPSKGREKRLLGAVRVDQQDISSFAIRLLQAAGAPLESAEEVTKHLIRADTSGHSSHGLLQLPRYLREIESGQITATARPRISEQRGATATVDGNWGFGQVAAKFAAELAASIAGNWGVAAVGLRHSNHVGRLGDYTGRAADQGYAMMMMTALVPGTLVVPPGMRKGVLSTNPISIAFPTHQGVGFCLDYATSITSGSKILLSQYLGKEIAPGMLLDVDGQPTTDPSWLGRGGMIPSFGGYKGYGLSVAILLLAGAMTGGAIDDHAGERGGSLIIAIDVTKFPDSGLAVELGDSQLDWVRNGGPGESSSPNVIPGEPEAEARRQSSATGTVSITRRTFSDLQSFAGKWRVLVPQLRD